MLWITHSLHICLTFVTIVRSKVSFIIGKCGQWSSNKRLRTSSRSFWYPTNRTFQIVCIFVLLFAHWQHSYTRWKLLFHSTVNEYNSSRQQASLWCDMLSKEFTIRYGVHCRLWFEMLLFAFEWKISFQKKENIVFFSLRYFYFHFFHVLVLYRQTFGTEKTEEMFRLKFRFTIQPLAPHPKLWLIRVCLSFFIRIFQPECIWSMPTFQILCVACTLPAYSNYLQRFKCVFDLRQAWGFLVYFLFYLQN